MTGRGTRGRPRGSTAQAIQQQQAAAAAAAQQQQLLQQQQQAAVHQQQLLKQQQQQQQQQYNIPPQPPGAQQQSQPGDQPTLYTKPTDKNLSLLFDELLPEAQMYHKLQEVERKIDATLYRKKLDLQDLMSRNMRTHETMRIFISNSVKDQPWQVMAAGLDDGSNTFVFDGSSTSPSFNLRIEGRLLEEKESLESSKRRLFSSYFTSIIVEFENLSDPSERTIAEWHETTDPLEKQAAVAQQQQNKLGFDVLDIRRNGDRPVKAKILFQVKEYPDKFMLSPPLARIIAIDEETKAGVVFALWQYIKFNKLQDIEHKRTIKCDAALRQLFGCDSFIFAQLPALIQPFLLPRAPVIIDYTVQVDKENNIGDFVFDVEIEKDHPMKEEMAELLGNWNEHQAEIQTLDDQIAQTIQAMNANRLKYQFMDSMAKNPVDTVSQWLESQASDLRLIMSDKGFNEEEVRRSDFYTDDVLNQTIHMFLNTKR